MEERPFDFLNSRKGEDISVKIINQENLIEGKLVAFDLHINLVLQDNNGIKQFIKGETVERILE